MGVGCASVAVTADVVAQADADAWLRDALARVLGANECWERLAAELRVRTSGCGRRTRGCRQRLMFGRSSERMSSGAGAGEDAGGGEPAAGGGGPAGEQTGSAATPPRPLTTVRRHAS